MMWKFLEVARVKIAALGSADAELKTYELPTGQKTMDFVGFSYAWEVRTSVDIGLYSRCSGSNSEESASR